MDRKTLVPELGNIPLGLVTGTDRKVAMCRKHQCHEERKDRGATGMSSLSTLP
jgi:hypothetical protein